MQVKLQFQHINMIPSVSERATWIEIVKEGDHTPTIFWKGPTQHYLEELSTSGVNTFTELLEKLNSEKARTTYMRH